MIMPLLVGFGAGVAAQQGVTAAKMLGEVRDANTLREEIEYWELRAVAGGFIVVSGDKDLPIITSLRQAKGRRVVLTVDRADQASAIGDPPQPRAPRD